MTTLSAKWNGRRVLVTGATGLVGSWLVKELLSAGATVVALVRDADPQSELLRSGDIRRVSVVSGTLQDIDVLDRAITQHDVDHVFHLGAQTQVMVARRSPLETFESNIRGTYNLLEACRRHSDLVRGVVVASSDKAYGDQPELPYVEDMPLRGSEPYDWSKACVDQCAALYARVYGTPVAVARCGNVYGGGDLNWNRIVPGTIRSLLHHERPVIRSNGNLVRDYIYVRDAVGAYITLAEHVDNDAVRGEAFNFGLEMPVTVLDMVRAIERATGVVQPPDVRNNAAGEIPAQYVSAAKARRVLGWASRFGLVEGLAETVDWYRRFFSVPMLEGISA
jgi:CDP-glucose 4,6-dehydratase